jgi:hypothetical protein
MAPALVSASATAAAATASGTSSACKCHQRLFSFRVHNPRHPRSLCSRSTAYSQQHQQLRFKCHALQGQHRAIQSHPQQQWQQQHRRSVTTAAASAAAGGAAGPGDAADGSWLRKVVLPMALVLLVCNMDRICLSVAILPMAQEYGWPATVQVSSTACCCIL